MPKVALAIGGAALLAVTAVAARTADGLIGGPRGVLAGVLVCGAVFGVCGLVFRDRPRPALHPGRPARRCDPPAAPAATQQPTRLAA